LPYPEYHTSDDEPSIIREDMLVEAAEIAERIVRIHATDFVPKRTFMGPVFLSGNGLWVDWRESWELNRAIERIMMSFEGDMTVFEIAEAVGLDYWVVREYVEKFREKGFVEAKPV
jgi:aminopeptidase-like protein